MSTLERSFVKETRTLLIGRIADGVVSILRVPWPLVPVCVLVKLMLT